MRRVGLTAVLSTVFFFIILSWGNGLVDTSYLLCKHSRTKLPLTYRSTTFVSSTETKDCTPQSSTCIQCAAINILLRFHTIYTFFTRHRSLLSRWDYFCFYSYDWFFFVSVYSWGAGVLNYYQPLKFRFNINWSVGKSLIFLVQCFLYIQKWMNDLSNSREWFVLLGMREFD